MNKFVRRSALVGALCVAPAGATLATVMPAGTASASSASGIPVNYVVNASTTLAKLHQTVVVPPGTFKGTVAIPGFALEGVLKLPPASTTVTLAGVGLATATFKLAETKPVTGVVDLSNLTVTATSTFNVLITSVNPLGLPINLVGNSCGTSKPVSVTFSGKFSFGGSSSFSGSYKIPQLSNCGALTAALNLVIPGPGNIFNATFAPA
jgi:hypothetical protein